MCNSRDEPSGLENRTKAFGRLRFIFAARTARLDRSSFNDEYKAPLRKINSQLRRSCSGLRITREWKNLLKNEERKREGRLSVRIPERNKP